MTKKKKILIIADSPLAPSGVGTQTKYMIEGMLKTNEFSFVCLAFFAGDFSFVSAVWK